MKIWTYGEMEDKIKRDLDLEDETFISPNEMIGYFNEALNEAESEIMALNQDYFLTKFFLPLIAGTQQYQFPDNIYANKIRGIIYSNGSIQYTVDQYRRKDKFEEIALTEQYGVNDDYRYFLQSDAPGQRHLELRPPSRETAIMPPASNAFTPMTMWYIRNCARVPLIGEYCNPEVVNFSQINIGTDEITVGSGFAPYGLAAQQKVGSYKGSIPYRTGDKVKVRPLVNGTLPGGLNEYQEYWVISNYVAYNASYTIKLATSKALALAGTAIDLTSQGAGNFVIEVAATTSIVSAALIDIPEFATFVMQWVKCRCLEKEGDPRLKDAADLLAQQKVQMVDTLTQGIVDDDDKIQPDFTHYQDST